MLGINQETLAEIAAESIARINPEQPNAKRWINAIAKAVVEIENNPFMTWQPESHSLLILSDSGNIYTANGTCQCKAYASGYPCKHRAAARLIVRYHEKAD